jgi:hypothetical protein
MSDGAVNGAILGDEWTAWVKALVKRTLVPSTEEVRANLSSISR